MDAPLIGLTTYGRNAQHRFDLPDDYVDAVRRAGGIPVLMPPGEPRLAEWMQTIDALILTGGGDIDPAVYEGEAHPALDRVDAERDASELEAVRTVLKSRMPCLCICRGAQLLNVALGGSLHEHLPDVFGEEVPHTGPAGEEIPHPVHIQAGSFLSRVVGTTETSPPSKHHQAIDEVGQGLEVVARAPDGVVEAVELAAHPWLVAVQWHPEFSAATDPAQQRIFDELVRAARERSGSETGTRGAR